MAARKSAKTVTAVSLTRTSAKHNSSVNVDYAPFTRALWNMGDAAESATAGNAFYARKRDELLATLDN